MASVLSVNSVPAAAPLPLLPDLLSERVSPLKGRWFQRDLPYSWDFFMENVLDPTHVDYAHHGVAGGLQSGQLLDPRPDPGHHGVDSG
jgi:phenylpropionate dioxygenase-like ring-hydroxylating dioxygenase large terminal subunit